MLGASYWFIQPLLCEVNTLLSTCSYDFPFPPPNQDICRCSVSLLTPSPSVAMKWRLRAVGLWLPSQRIKLSIFCASVTYFLWSFRHRVTGILCEFWVWTDKVWQLLFSNSNFFSLSEVFFCKELKFLILFISKILILVKHNLLLLPYSICFS